MGRPAGWFHLRKGRPRRPVEPILDKLVEGKSPKEIAYEMGLGLRCVDYHLNRYVKESGSRTLIHAVLKYDRTKR